MAETEEDCREGQGPRPAVNPCPSRCRRQDLNLHEVNPHQALNLARLPIPPLRRPRVLIPYGATAGQFKASSNSRPKPVRSGRAGAIIHTIVRPTAAVPPPLPGTAKTAAPPRGSLA